MILEAPSTRNILFLKIPRAVVPPPYDGTVRQTHYVRTRLVRVQYTLRRGAQMMLDSEYCLLRTPRTRPGHLVDNPCNGNDRRSLTAAGQRRARDLSVCVVSRHMLVRHRNRADTILKRAALLEHLAGTWGCRTVRWRRHLWNRLLPLRRVVRTARRPRRCTSRSRRWPALRWEGRTIAFF